MTTRASTLDGILLVDKPEGASSAEVVRLVKRELACKIGHLGTLDPFATGLLPLCLGEGTKIAQFLTDADKKYSGVVRLGIRTDSGDRTGVVVEERPCPTDLSAARCAEVAAAFVGEHEQVPPMYSALKRDGVPLYKLARRGVEVEREARRVRLYSLALVPLSRERLQLGLHCSKGTYVRVVAEEIGAALGTVAHLESLRRESFGHFRVEDAVGLPVSADSVGAALISPRRALARLEEIQVDDATALRVRRGQVGVLLSLGRPAARDSAAKLIGRDGALLAVVSADPAGRWQFARVMS